MAFLYYPIKILLMWKIGLEKSEKKISQLIYSIVVRPMLRIPHIFGKRPDDGTKIKFRLNSAIRTKGPGVNGHLCLESVF